MFLKSKRKTFLSTENEKYLSVAKCRTAQMENEAMSAVISQYCGTKVTLMDILQNRVTTECLSIFNTNGSMIKTQKSKLLQSFTLIPLDSSELQSYTALVDMEFFGDYVFHRVRTGKRGMKRNTLGMTMPKKYFCVSLVGIQMRLPSYL